MPIGNSYSQSGKNIIKKILLSLFGIIDLHSHIRLNPIIRFLKDYICNFKEKEIRILEPGCGNGINAFELAKIAAKYGRRLNYFGIDIDEKGINEAKRIVGSNRFSGDFLFHQGDAIDLLKDGEDLQVDVILLIDIIEHISDPNRFSKIVNRHLKEGGIFAISVPTPIYPKIFGKKFHKKIGHVIDGYSLKDMDELFMGGLNCPRVAYRYNTGLFSNIGCFLYYNFLSSENKYVNFLKSILLYPFRFLDFYNSSLVSCSLFAVYKK